MFNIIIYKVRNTYNNNNIYNSKFKTGENVFISRFH